MENLIETAENKELYETKWKEQWNIAREHYGPLFFHRKRIIQRIIKKIKNNLLTGRVLEIGCGDGSLLSLFQGNTNKLYGCDISENAIQLAKKKFGDIAIFNIGDIIRLDSLPGGEFDCIICSEVLEHIENDELAIENLYHKLKKGGYLIVTVPHIKKYWLPLDWVDGHVRRYEKAELRKKMAKFGFTICEIKTWGYPLLHLYYKVVLKNVQERLVVKIVKKSELKRILSFILRSIFYIDDFFIPLSKGRNIYVLAKKTEDLS